MPIPLDAELKRATWFDPLFVVEVFIRGLGNSGILRQPSLKAVRMDKSVDDLRDSDRSKSPAKKAVKKTTARVLHGRGEILSVRDNILLAEAEGVYVRISDERRREVEMNRALDWRVVEP